MIKPTFNSTDPGIDSLVADRITLLSSPTPYQMAEEWFDLARADHFWFQWRFRALERLIDFPVLPEPILEIGCGNGVARSQVEARYDCTVTGVDVSLPALQRALPGRGDLYFYDILERRTEWQGRFATVLLLDTLEHITQPVPFLEAVAYHMRRRGLLIVNVPALQWLYSRYDQVAGHVKRYRRRLLRKELTDAGFLVLRQSYWGLPLIPVALARKLVLRSCASDQVIRTGFQPSSRMVDLFLRTLMHAECGTALPPPLGVSLVAMAQKRS